MTNIFHKDLTGEDLHATGYCQATDPGAIGAGKTWIDTGLGTGQWVLKIRNSSNTGWEVVSTTSTPTDNLVPYTGATSNVNFGNHQYYGAEYEDEVDVNNAVTVNWNNGNIHFIHLKSGENSITLTNGVADGKYSLIVQQPSFGSATIAFTPTPLWPNGLAPTLSTEALHIDIIDFRYSGVLASYLGISNVGYHPSVPDADLPVPTGLTYSEITTTTVTLIWNDTGDARVVSFNIYRDGVLIDNVSSLTFEDTGLAPGIEYVYRIESVDINNAASDMSSSLSATTTTYSDYFQTYSGITFFKDFTQNLVLNADFSLGSATGSFSRASGAGSWIDENGRVYTFSTGQTNEPRFTWGYYNSTGFRRATGLMIERGQTNYIPWSYVYSDASWTSTNITVDDADAGSTSPDAVATVSSLTATNASATIFLTTPVTARTYSVWLKRKTGVGPVFITADGGVSYTEVVLSADTWGRYQVVAPSSTSQTCGIRIITSGNAVYAWVSQFEGSPYMTSTIKTAGSALTRQNENILYAQPSNRTASTETMFVRFMPWQTFASDGNQRQVTNSYTGRQLTKYGSSGVGKLNFAPDSGSCIATTTTAPVGGTSYVVTTTCDEINLPHAQIFMDGTLQGSSNNTFVATAMTGSFWLGSSSYLDGIIQQALIYNNVLSNTDIANISTTLSSIAPIPPEALPVPISIPAHTARDFYVSNSTGSDLTGDGTIEAPYKTWSGSGMDETNAMVPGDRIFFKRGDTWLGADAEIYIASAGTEGSPITLDAYGTGERPILSGHSVYTGTWTYYNSGHAWVLGTAYSYSSYYTYSNNGTIYACISSHTATADNEPGVGASWQTRWRVSTTYKTTNISSCNMVSVDDTECLGKIDSISEVLRRPGRYRLSGTDLYVDLWDGTDPSTHTMRIGTTYPVHTGIITVGPEDEFTFVNGEYILTSPASYITIKNIDVKFSRYNGIHTGSDNTKIENCDTTCTGNEGINFMHYWRPGAQYGEARNCIVTAPVSGGGQGQGITVGSPYTWLIGCTVTGCLMEGIDFLDVNRGYTTTASPVRTYHGYDATYGGMINCVAYNNHRLGTYGSSNLYVDGGSHLFFYGNKFYANGKTGTSYATDSAGGVSVWAEARQFKRPDYIYFVNNLVYGNNGKAAEFGSGSFSTVNAGTWAPVSGTTTVKHYVGEREYYGGAYYDCTAYHIQSATLYNVFADMLASGVWVVSSGTNQVADHILLNNTFHRVGGSTTIGFKRVSDGQKAILVNNIVYGSNTTALCNLGTGDEVAQMGTSNYNSFWGQADIMIKSGVGYTYAEWRAANPSFDANSSYADNLLVDVTNENFDGHLQNGSPAIGTGNYDATWDLIPQWCKDKLAEEGITGIQGYVQSGSGATLETGESGTSWSMGYHFPTND